MLFFGGQRWICQAASGKPSTGRFSDPPFRIHFFMRNKKVIFFSEYYLIFGGQRWIRQAASGKPSTGRFSDPPFRIHFFYEKQKK